MFERYTEQARRVVFFARYEASTFGSPYIEPEHLLLGLLRECANVRSLFKTDFAERLRKKLQQEQGERPSSSTSVDLPLSNPAKQVLAFAVEEAKAPAVLHIECRHLFAGILRLDKAAVHTVLHDEAGDLSQLLERVRNALKGAEDQPRPASRPMDLLEDWISEAGKATTAPEFAEVHWSLWRIVWNAFEAMDCYSETFGNARLHRRPWTRKQALAYLIDWANQYRIWLGRALTEPNLRADRPPSEEATTVQDYGSIRWQFLAESWFSANCLLLHAIAALPGAKATMPCRIGVADPIPLEKLLAGLVEMTEDIMEQILARLG
jgi:hypothetical protein